jgi:hypothetical protein
MQISGVGGYELKRIVDGINRDYQTSINLHDLVKWSDPVKTRTGTVMRSIPKARFLLRLQDSADPFHRRKGKRALKSAGVCWHGASIFLMRMFKAHPDAWVKTHKMRYSGLDAFKQKFKQTGGSVAPGEPRYDELCDCEGASHEFLRLVVGELFEVVLPHDPAVLAKQLCEKEAEHEDQV